MSHEYTPPEKKKEKGKFKKSVKPKKGAKEWLETERPEPLIKPKDKDEVLEEWRKEPPPKFTPPKPTEKGPLW